MRKRDRKALGRYVRWMANELELRDWTIVVSDEPCEDEFVAQQVCVRGERQQTITFRHDFRDLDPEEQRETVIHELLHAHHEICWRMVQTDLSEPLGKIGYYVFCDAYRRAMEYQIDATAKALARHLPLIEWGS